MYVALTSQVLFLQWPHVHKGTNDIPRALVVLSPQCCAVYRAPLFFFFFTRGRQTIGGTGPKCVRESRQTEGDE